MVFGNERDGALAMLGEDGVLRLIVFPPKTCNGCKIARATFVNRYGSTLCVACDMDRDPSLPHTAAKTTRPKAE